MTSNEPTILTVNLDSCTFGGNEATDGFYGQGGALHFEDVNAVLTDCYLWATRPRAAAVCSRRAAPSKLRGGSVSGNTAIGGSGVYVGSLDLAILARWPILNRGNFPREDPGAGIDVGGGIVCAAAEAEIENCTFIEQLGRRRQGRRRRHQLLRRLRRSPREELSVRGQLRQAGRRRHLVRPVRQARRSANSTFAENTAERLGGAIFCDWSADASTSATRSSSATASMPSRKRTSASRTSSTACSTENSPATTASMTA